MEKILEHEWPRTLSGKIVSKEIMIRATHYKCFDNRVDFYLLKGKMFIFTGGLLKRGISDYSDVLVKSESAIFYKNGFCSGILTFKNIDYMIGLFSIEEVLEFAPDFTLLNLDFVENFMLIRNGKISSFCLDTEFAFPD